jgi:UDP-2-acetamido-3-amino-2,3-dideoxy-glucuronate N-acetyltransferase
MLIVNRIIGKVKNMVKYCKKGRIDDIFVHETAEIENNVTIGKGTKIWRWCHVESYAVLGEGVMLGMGVHIGPGVRIGNNVRIQDNCSVYRGVTLQDNVFVGPCVVFTNVNKPKIFRKAEFDDILVKEGAVLGANCTIVSPCTIGKNSFVAAGSVVIGDVPDNTMVAGNPAKIKKQIINDQYQYD